MKTKLTSTLATLAALMIIAVVPVSTNANVIAIEIKPCAISVSPDLNNMTKINFAIPRINKLISNNVIRDELVTTIAVKDIDINTANIGII